jgi:hypothetical protein
MSEVEIDGAGIWLKTRSTIKHRYSRTCGGEKTGYIWELVPL